MDLITAKKNQEILHEEATVLLEKLDLQTLFGAIGSVSLTGSYTYDLMVIPDVDFNVIVSDPLTKIEQITNLAEQLLHTKLVRKVSIVKNGYTSVPDTDKPIGIWFGIEADYQNRKWNIDTWFLKQEERKKVSLGFTMDRLSAEQKDTILRLKAQLHEMGRYGPKKEYTSADVYKAVVLHNATKIADLRKSE